MKHLIIGSGTVGFATGRWLEANNEEVYYNDIDAKLLKKLKNHGHNVVGNIRNVSVDVYWVCTAEWDVEQVMAILSQIKINHIVAVRSTVAPGVFKKLSDKYGPNQTIAHVPEFLKASVPLDDIFNPDRVIIGADDSSTIHIFQGLFHNLNVPMVVTTLETSSLIKLVSNAWLSTQISFWNEIKKLCDKYNVNPEEVANAVTLDHRISRYGSNMIGEPFGGFCLPKDLSAIIKLFGRRNFFDSVMKVNENVKKG